MYFSNTKAFKTLFKKPKLFVNYYLFWGERIAYLKLFGKKKRPKRYAGRKVLDLEQGCKLIKESILSGKPFMAGRFGSNELCLMIFSYFRQIGLLKNKHLLPPKEVIENCGFFPKTVDAIEKFGDLMIESLEECDTMCVWYNICEDYFIQNSKKKDIDLTHRKVLDFWNYEESWTSALAGKKVLVIHPLDELIKSQYEKRKELFKNTSYLPDFELLTLKAVQTIAGVKDQRFESWFDALDYMYERAMKLDFDIAIIGCGAYGYPLAAKIKKSGKQAIHMGGVLQILFGIKGNRWENDAEPKLLEHVNDNWIKPQKKDVPENSQQVEGACYW